MGRDPGSEFQVKAPSDLNIHLGHRELLKMKARVKLSLPVLCHKPAGSPWVGHLTSPYPSSLVCKMRGLYCLTSKSSTARMLWFFVLAFSRTWRKYIHLHFMGRNGETKRTWSICSGTTPIFWPQLSNSLANHLISLILFSHWYKIQRYHRIQDVGRIKREDEYKVHGLQPACWALSLSRLFQAWSSKEKGDKQTVYSSLEPGERLPLHNQNRFLSPDEQLPLSPCLVLLGGTDCVSHREMVWPVCAPGSILWGMILIWAPSEIVLSWEKQHVDKSLPCLPW